MRLHWDTITRDWLYHYTTTKASRPKGVAYYDISRQVWVGVWNGSSGRRKAKTFNNAGDAKAWVEKQANQLNLYESNPREGAMRFRDVPVGSTFRFKGSGSGSFMGQSTYRKTGTRTYMPADVEAAERDLLDLYSGYPDIRRKLRGAKLRKAVTLRAGSVNAEVVQDNPRSASVPKHFVPARVRRLPNGQLHVHLLTGRGKRSSRRKRR